MNFLEQPKTKDNRIDLNKIPHNYYHGPDLSHSAFSECFISFDDGSTALLKVPLSAMPSTSRIYPYGGFQKYQPDEYNPLLVKEIANVAKIPCAEYFLAYNDKYNYIITPSFLGKDDELILGSSLTSKHEFDVNYLLYDIENSLSRRKFSPDEINKIKSDFIKQGFVNKFVGNIDEQSRNFGIILNNRHVKLAPFFDLDYAFGITDTLGFDRHINGDKSLQAYIKNFQDYPGFIDFVKNFINNLNVEKLFIDVENSTGVKATDFLIKRYTSFINNKINETKKTLNSIEKGEYILE